MAALARSAAPSLVLGLFTALLLQFVVRLPGGREASLDTNPTSRITWSLVVCLALGLATTVARRRVAAMSAAGAASASAAFVLARAARRGSVSLLRALETGSPTPWLLGGVKVLEYGCLGALLAVIARRSGARAIVYVALGLAVGVGFGTASLLLTLVAARSSPGLPAFLTWLVNEVVFPAGCALVIWTVDRHGKKVPQSRGFVEEPA